MSQKFDYISSPIAYHFLLSKKVDYDLEMDIPDEMVEVFIFRMKDELSQYQMIFEYKNEEERIDDDIYGLMVEVELKSGPAANSSVFRLLPDPRYSPGFFFRNDESIIVLFQMFGSSLTDYDAQRLTFKSRLFPLLLNSNTILEPVKGLVGDMPTNIGRVGLYPKTNMKFVPSKLTIGSYPVTDDIETIEVLSRSTFSSKFLSPREKIRKFCFIPSARVLGV